MSFVESQFLAARCCMCGSDRKNRKKKSHVLLQGITSGVIMRYRETLKGRGAENGQKGIMSDIQTTGSQKLVS